MNGHYSQFVLTFIDDILVVANVSCNTKVMG